MELKWRALTLLVSGVFSIYLVGFFQDTPYPHPVTLETEDTTDAHIESTQVLLTKIDDYFYKTQIHFDATLKGNRGRLMGISSIQLYVNGYITQSRKQRNDTDWQDCFSHILPGPITHYSTSLNDRFAVLYHTVTDENIDYYARVYYHFDEKTEYKDFHLPGNTNIRSFTLEENTLLYSRDPDQYRFRVIHLPKGIFTKKSKPNDKPIELTSSQPGEPTRAYHQPKGSKNQVGILSKLYSSNENIYRVVSLDIHQTRNLFYINATLVDGITTKKNEIQWIRRDHMNATHEIVTTPEYMTFTDEIYQRHAEKRLPRVLMASLANKKTVVMPILEDSFLTLDYTNNTERLVANKGHHKFLYKDDGGQFLPEIYFWMQDDIYHDDVTGMQLNREGTVLAVWTNSNSVYVYQRGRVDHAVEHDPHQVDRKLEWILKKKILPLEGRLGSYVPIGSALFWDDEDAHSLSIILKNGVVNTYSMDTVMEQRGINFRYFLYEKWELLIAMSAIITFHILSEIRNFP